jgi:hypothetical protein
MLTDQSPARRFRVEALEERIAPASSFWTDSLLGRMIAEWFVGNEVENAQLQLPDHSLSAGQNHQFGDTFQTVETSAGKAFPVWASDLLEQFENEGVEVPQASVSAFAEDPVPMYAGPVTNDSRSTEHPPETMPVWAEQMLADVGKTAATRSIGEANAGPQAVSAMDLDSVMQQVAVQQQMPPKAAVGTESR